MPHSRVDERAQQGLACFADLDPAEALGPQAEDEGSACPGNQHCVADGDVDALAFDACQLGAGLGVVDATRCAGAPHHWGVAQRRGSLDQRVAQFLSSQRGPALGAVMVQHHDAGTGSVLKKLTRTGNLLVASCLIGSHASVRMPWGNAVAQCLRAGQGVEHGNEIAERCALLEAAVPVRHLGRRGLHQVAVPELDALGEGRRSDALKQGELQGSAHAASRAVSVGFCVLSAHQFVTSAARQRTQREDKRAAGRGKAPVFIRA